MIGIVVMLAGLATTFNWAHLVQVSASNERIIAIPPLPLVSVDGTRHPRTGFSESNLASNAGTSDDIYLTSSIDLTNPDTEDDENRDDDNVEDSSDSDDNDLSSATRSPSVVLSEASIVALGSMNAAFKLGSVLNATSTIEQTYVNWVGKALDTSSSSACWRKAHIAKSCPLGFDSKLGMCWTQCPYSYPVKCGLECIRQNDDCGSAVFSKVAVIVQTAISLSSWSIYGDMTKWAKKFQRALKCTKYMIGLTKSLIKYVRYINLWYPETTQEKLLSILYQIDNVIIDIPVAITYCKGGKVSMKVKYADSALTTAEYILREVMSNGEFIVSSWGAFKSFMKNITFGGVVSTLNKTDITSLKSALKSNSTCGYDMKRLLDRTWMTVAELRRLNPDISEDDIRVIMSHSNLMLNDIPIATNNCMNELMVGSDEHTAYATRDKLRKTFGAIVDDLISSGTSNNGTLLTAGEYAFKIADRAVGFWSIWDPFYISSVVSEYVEPICGPTHLIGEIDDGSAEKALGMSIVRGAFNNSDGMWTKIGDGTVTITFKSVDTEDVSVNIKSGGHKIAEVPVPAGKTVKWISNTTTLGGKTLYLDRWRPGFLGLPGTRGGSLLLWIPHSTQGGSLQLNATLNVS